MVPYYPEGLTDEGLLAQVLRLLEVVLPLEHGKSLVDQGQDIDTHRLAVLLHVHGLVEFLNGLGELLLVEQKLTKVVVDIGDILEVLLGSTERRHGRGNRTQLVLCHTQLDVGIDETAVQINRLLIILGGFGELSEDKVELSPVVVDVGVILVVSNGQFKVILGSILVSCLTLAAVQEINKEQYGLPSSRCRLARLT